MNPASIQCRISQEWYEFRGLDYVIMIAFGAVRGARTKIGFGRHRDEGPIGDEEVALARLFIPHLKRALTISCLLDARSLERDSFAADLDGLAVSVLLVGPDLRIVHASRAADCGGQVWSHSGNDGKPSFRPRSIITN